MRYINSKPLRLSTEPESATCGARRGRRCRFACRPHLQVAAVCQLCVYLCHMLLAASFSSPDAPSEAIFSLSFQNIFGRSFVYSSSIFHLPTFLPSIWLLVIPRCLANSALLSLSASLSPHLPLLLQLSPLERRLFSLRPDERLWRTIKMLFKCKGVCVRVRDISC